MKRSDDYLQRREHLKNLSDEELKNRFWELAEQVVDPMLQIGYKNTTPSVERSVLLRMGFSSIETKSIVDVVMKKGLMPKGCGNVVWRLSKKLGLSIRETGVAICNGKYIEEIDNLF